MPQPDGSDIAVIGLAGRFPGAPSAEEFWTLLRDGTEAVTRLTEQELLAEGIERHVLDNPRYVRAKGVLDGPDLFDAGFFGYSPRDAAAIDPQQRLFLECAWHALEDAGVDPERAGRAIGVYAGSSTGTYLTRPLRELSHLPEFMELVIGNDKDMLATRTSYKLDLRGPSVCVQSACSTSLVAVHVAAQGLLSGDCDIALAGGSSVMFPSKEGYHFQEEGIYSHDGHCRAFDARASGTVPGDGVGVVVLKLLTDALADGDRVHAVIKATAVNNDGALKVGYTAPSIAGQAEVIRAAHRAAGVHPATIGYLEAHGTATPLGDPAEIAGLTRAFRAGTDRAGYCAIGSVKSSIGHLDAAAGIAGLIKTVLALKHRTLPPSVNFESADPALGIEGSPFYVGTEAAPWPADATPRRAGVSSFGIGGTNAHAVLEEAPQEAAREDAGAAADDGEAAHLLLLSARTAEALEDATDNLAAHLRDNPELDLADAAYTTQVGRKAFEYRRHVVARTGAEAVRALSGEGGRRPRAERRPDSAPPVAFLLPGQGAQHERMAAGLYRTEPVFRAEFDRCCEHLAAELGTDLRAQVLADGARVEETWLAQPALVAVEYALARLWQSWGVRPQAILGHSLGEYTAACLAGVFSMEDTLTLAGLRGRLMQHAKPGAMLGVQLPERELTALADGLALAAVNADDLCVVSGPVDRIAELADRLTADGIGVRRLHTTRAFHSPMMADAARELRELVAAIPARPPAIPFVSNVTGTWITDRQATDPDYWAEHTLAPVRFADGLRTLAAAGNTVLLEVGPGQTLSTLARQGGDRAATVVSSMRHPRSPRADCEVLAEAVGTLWEVGAPIDWKQQYVHRRPRLTALPRYPFERRRHWLAQLPGATTVPAAPAPAAVRAEEPPTGRPADQPAEELFGGPEAELQRAVAAIWEELLGVPRIGPADDFFRLGGHSLLGTRLTTRLREQFGVEVRLRELFAEPTVAAQADLVAVLTGFAQGRPEHGENTEEGEL
ncbi:acyltransferase domain-containing protein [Kitasatospora sp. NBC_00374]|uniref:type I polyketide synthase n=1 Tax=Kitasatospora sp. NBC_00374 TaxID=2975964 RepID=UPI0032516832